MGAAYLSDAIGAAVGAQAPIFERGDRRRRDLFHPAALRDQAEQAELVVEPVERRLGAWRAARFIIDDGKAAVGIAVDAVGLAVKGDAVGHDLAARSEEHTSELQSLMRISYAVFCLKKNKGSKTTTLVEI